MTKPRDCFTPTDLVELIKLDRGTIAFQEARETPASMAEALAGAADPESLRPTMNAAIVSGGPPTVPQEAISDSSTPTGRIPPLLLEGLVRRSGHDTDVYQVVRGADHEAAGGTTPGHRPLGPEGEDWDLSSLEEQGSMPPEFPVIQPPVVAPPVPSPEVAETPRHSREPHRRNELMPLVVEPPQECPLGPDEGVLSPLQYLKFWRACIRDEGWKHFLRFRFWPWFRGWLRQNFW